MININSKIKKVLPVIVGGVAVSVILTSLYKQKIQREKMQEQEIVLETLLEERDLVIDELIYLQDILTEMEENLEIFSNKIDEGISIHEIEEEDN